MAEPIVFVSHSRVVDGQLDGLRGFLRDGAPMLRAAKPRTLAFLPYVSEDGRELSIVHLFADADAFTAHLDGVADRSSAADAFIRTVGYAIYGQPADDDLAMLRAGADAMGVDLRVEPELLSGFLRT